MITEPRFGEQKMLADYLHVIHIHRTGTTWERRHPCRRDPGHGNAPARMPALPGFQANANSFGEMQFIAKNGMENA